ncbi:uncharacterized protein LOC126836113 isoform X32 [Adelges cooleyi]|uniref:uncharacterized protein LOC126836113 isoform X17 n=1 Tax=Adelges cooleyi TaxID=133065 RepID=UPI00217FCA8A|nr:uncharacterized protein LOC126836113 isoform X17 [Adelges cooleyi]XP_050425141.1 uncharacterized protein LOC126836113 isoform X18 [Adelges cooleyi]XP_050425142.1 uncharacterized protein LOC126836113 isoform X19 [Adelges cooleyi]XP_050425143.1 uncharacterized protein LOC126836113 isoform X20 [Adelges cooleyi]XP_050425144.1 uncharacterized protein LOC126836113 isoform X21 [Adelges cooleyi]XP_050425145.1 uncharacterized protein LOC126836113 isoform X22 [Adelges cooleyi]XP_050425146.1 uncharac
MAPNKVYLVLAIAICTVSGRDLYLFKRDEVVGASSQNDNIASSGLIKREAITEKAYGMASEVPAGSVTRDKIIQEKMTKASGISSRVVKRCCGGKKDKTGSGESKGPGSSGVSYTLKRSLV